MGIDFNKLNYLVTLKLDVILNDLGVSYDGDPCYQVRARCPIHGGDNRSACAIDGINTDKPGIWRCWSHHCHETFNSTILGFIRGALSKLELDWKVDGDEIINFGRVVEYCQKILDANEQEINSISIKNRAKDSSRDWTGHCFSRKVISRWLNIPSPYYLRATSSRAAYSAKTLERYAIGDCNSYGKFYNRAVVPIFGENDRAVAFTARSLFQKCKKCELYHNGECPEKVYPSHNKWYHENLKSSEILYNYYESKEFFKSEKIAIVVESPGNVLRLEDAAIPGSVATFGAKISDTQLELLIKAGVETLILAFDGDDAGISGAKRVANKYQKDINIIIPNLELPANKDIGDFNSNLVNKNLKRILKKNGISLFY